MTSSWLFFLCNITTLVIFQAFGILPDCCTMLYNIARGSHKISTASARTPIGSPSGPPAESLLAFFISAATDSGVTHICSRMSSLDCPFPMSTLGPSGSTDGFVTRSNCGTFRTLPMSITVPFGLFDALITLPQLLFVSIHASSTHLISTGSPPCSVLSR